MSQLLNLVLALGPIFGISTLLGDTRAKILSEWLLRRARAIASAAVLVLLAALGFLVFIAALVVVILIKSSFEQSLESAGEDVGCIGLLLLLGAIAVSIGGSWLLLKTEVKVLGTLGMKLNQKWREALPSSSVPWPLN